MESGRRCRRSITALVSAVVVGLGGLVADQSRVAAPAEAIGGPFARLLAESADLGPATTPQVQLTAALHRTAEPVRLIGWGAAQGLSVRWRAGDPWAIIEGRPEAISDALGVAVHDYRARSGPDPGRVFYASRQQPDVPVPVSAEVAGLGRILSYTPFREGRPPTPPLDVPDGGLLPTQLLTAYNVMPLTSAGYTGKGRTVVVFSFDGFDQADMDSFADWFGLPRFTPQVVGGMPERRSGESTMDLQMIHAIAPEAKLVMVNARPTVEGGATYEKLGRLMESVDRQFPGAVWSLSIGWGCDRLLTAADLAPVRSALAKAHRRGTTAFDASGDMAGLECRGGKNWSDPPSADDVGVDAVASLPEMTAVGGTTLSTDANGRWLAEQAWYDVPLTQGTAGGASVLFGRPPWQAVSSNAGPGDRRLVPDISAVADPFTGVKFVFGQQIVVGGGTSQAAPIWAGLATVINQRLGDQNMAPLGDFNPLLYQVATGSAVPGFRDIDLGGNAISPSGSGYDMVTGLGTPNVDNLVKNILLIRSVGR
ncbi:MAG: S53 family peptidase [Actinomycetia bacterium]|nr:S53 family peptidase [Actinomycetes bacterium]